MSVRLLHTFNPITGEALAPGFQPNNLEDLEDLVARSRAASGIFRKVEGVRRARLLELIAEEILEIGPELVATACQETGLPEARIIGERTRTVNQLRLFADLVRNDSWKEIAIDTADPGRQPIPKPDTRKTLIPVGPVAIFTASNFPLALSTAGADTASALAAGNPVIVKAHNAHLGTNQLVAEAIKRAIALEGLPEGVFGTVIGADFEVGRELVCHPDIQAVAFTGSFEGGKALLDMATQREVPIPVFAEMSSINPTIILPSAITGKASALAKQLVGSVALGVGQFCTKPGLIILMEGLDSQTFIDALRNENSQAVGGTMLHEGIFKNFQKKYLQALQTAGVEILSKGSIPSAGLAASPTIAVTTAQNYLSNGVLQQEVFGPFSLVVRCKNDMEALSVLKGLGGQLTVTFRGDKADLEKHPVLVDVAEQMAGRVLFNGVPTGVEVCHSMVHGGPFPATSNANYTSQGTGAIKRFVRPVCYQDAPQAILPPELRDVVAQPTWRKVNGEFTTAAVVGS